MSKKSNYIISAGDKNFFLCFIQFIYSFERHKEYNNSQIIYYDLGLSDEQRDQLDKKVKEVSWLEIRKFDFSQYPAYYAPQNQNYAWKPTLIYEVFEEKKGNILYLDSANLILKNLKSIWDVIEEKGTYVPIAGSGSLAEWTLQDTLDYMNVPKELYSARNRAGNTCGFSYRSETIRGMISRWKELAAVEECIFPKGATRHNHKSDQSIMTILLNELAMEGAIELTDDEVDISSGNPTSYISVRKKVSDKMILPIGFWTYSYFRIQRIIDILINKLKKN